jgi:hypothetical protein
MVPGNTMAAIDILQNMALIGATSTVSGGRIMRVNMGVTGMRQNMTLVAANIMVEAIINEETLVRATASSDSRNRRAGIDDVHKY